MVTILPTVAIMPFVLAGRGIAVAAGAFLLGGQLKPATLRVQGREIMALSLCVVLTSAAFVATGLWFPTGDPVPALMLAGAAYILLRAASRVPGGWIGGAIAGLPAREGRLSGLALMPQAGVAIGMVLIASERFPERAETILAVAIASTVVIEVLGPMIAVIALKQANGRRRREAG